MVAWVLAVGLGDAKLMSGGDKRVPDTGWPKLPGAILKRPEVGGNSSVQYLIQLI
ncbi:hypothetical protein FPOAC2_06542 [Fusarium poae]|jgi:hypothetical protein